jgi:hypothetical protein
VAEAAIAPHVDHDVALEGVAELGRQLGGERDRFGSSPFTCRIGACTILAMSDG